MLEFRHLDRLSVIEHLERGLRQIVHWMAVANDRRRQLNEVDVHLLHELRRVDHHQIFDRRLRGIVLQRCHYTQVTDPFALRNIDGLHPWRPEQRCHARVIEKELDVIELFAVGDGHRHLHPRLAVDVQRDAR